MTLDSSSIRHLHDLCQHVDDGVNEDITSRIETAQRRVCDDLSRSGGYVDALGEPEIHREREAELAAIQRPAFDGGAAPVTSLYGIDASSTQPREFLNGVTVGLAAAVCSMLGDGDETIERRSRLVSSVYYRDGVDVDLSGGTVHDGGDQAVDLEIVGEGRRQSGMTDWVRTSALALAEGRHAVQVADTVDGPLLFDGGIYPQYPLYEYAFARNASDRGQAAALSETSSHAVAQEAAQLRIDAIDAIADTGYPVLGITKTTQSSMLVNALEAKVAGLRDSPPIPWGSDSQFLGEALYSEEPDEFTWTTWFEQTKIAIDPVREALAGFEYGSNRNASDYRRAFFYVRIPQPEGVLFRVETPRFLIDTPEKRIRLQAFALREIAEAHGLPMVVQRADRQARISKHTERQLFGSFSMPMVRDYNRDVRFGPGPFANRRLLEELVSDTSGDESEPGIEDARESTPSEQDSTDYESSTNRGHSEDTEETTHD